jgi:hypothetical protein
MASPPQLTAYFQTTTDLDADFSASPDLEIQFPYAQTVPDLTVLGFETIWSEAGMPSSIYHAVAAAGNNAALIKSSAGTLTGWAVYNNLEEDTIFVKLYDTNVVPNPASLEPKQVIAITPGLVSIAPPSDGFTYENGIGIAIVTGIADNDNSGVSLDACVVDIFYQ